MAIDKKKKSNITFLIFAYNEEKRIEYPIRCFLPYGEVIVVDNFSSDNTCAVAKKCGARVIQYKNQGWVETEKEADFVFKHVKTDWVFWGFADEIVPKTCLDLYRAISRQLRYKIVIQKKKTLLFDPKSEFLACDVTVNFFRKDSIDFSNNIIHQTGKFASHVKPSEILYLPPIDEYSVYHFSGYTTESIVSNFNIYSTIDAKSISSHHLSIKLIIDPIITFFLTYLYRGAYKHGIKGFIVSMQFMFYTFLSLAKAYELHNNIDPKSIEKKFIESKNLLLAKSPKSTIIQKLIANIEIALISRLHLYYKLRKNKKNKLS